MFAHTGVLHARFQLHFRRPKTRSPHEVVGKIKWKQPVNALTERSVEVCCFCQPERRQPSGKMQGIDSDKGKDCNPFWHIRRSNEAGTCNSAVVGLEIKVITSSGMAELKTADNMPPEVLCDYEVTVPCIVNTKKIEKAEEIVLKLGTVEGGKTHPKTAPKKRVITAFTQGTEKKQKT